MAVTTSLRMGVTQWSDPSDELVRDQLHSSFASLETKLLGFVEGTVRPAPTPVLMGFVFFNTNAKTLFYCDGTTWWRIVGGAGGFASPQGLLITSTQVNGVSELASRSDHVHSLPAFGSPVALGTSNAAGTGNAPARADHVHVIGTGAINESAKLATGVVEGAAIADGSVTTDKIANGAVIESNILNDAITTGKIALGAITTEKIQDGAATGDKVANIDAGKFTSGILDPALIPDLSADKITSGTLDIARFDDIDDPITPGEILWWGGTTPPNPPGQSHPFDYLLCNGQSVNKVTYADLYADIGGTFGESGDTFQVPDLRGRMVLGVAASGTGNTLGGTGGAFNHTHVGAAHTHTQSGNTNSTGAHTHANPNTGSDGGHTHTRPSTASGGSHSHSSGGPSSTINIEPAGTPPNSSLGSSSHTHTLGSAGSHSHSLGSTNNPGDHIHTIAATISNGAHTHPLSGATASAGNAATGTANPPYLALNAIIKT